MRSEYTVVDEVDGLLWSSKNGLTHNGKPFLNFRALFFFLECLLSYFLFGIFVVGAGSTVVVGEDLVVGFVGSVKYFDSQRVSCAEVLDAQLNLI
jgi:hypothetical protein